MGKISVIVVGSKKSGKTQLANCYLNLEFNASHEPTHGVSQLAASLEYGDHDIYMHDTGSQEQDQSQVQSYLKTNQYVVVVCIDSTNFLSLDEARSLLENSVKDLTVPVVLVRTKTDMHLQQQVSFAQVEKLAKQYDFSAIDSSALKGEVGILQNWIHANPVISYNPKFYEYLESKLEDLNTLITNKEKNLQNNKRGLFPKSEGDLTLEINTAKTLQAKLTTIMEKKDAHKSHAFIDELRKAVNETEQEHEDGTKKHGENTDAWYRRKPKIQKFTDALIADASHLKHSRTFRNNNNNNN